LDVISSKAPAAPDRLWDASSALKQEIQNHYARAISPIPPPLADIMTLTQNLASIAAPLYVDIRATL